MVNATCEKCGSQHALDEASVPPSGKVIKCPQCSHPITVMPPGATVMGLGGAAVPPAAPGRATAKDAGSRAATAGPPFGGAPAGRPSPPAADGGLDLPAPVGPTPTRGDGGLDLPAPKAPARTVFGTGPGRAPDAADLPAPVGPAPTRGDGGLDLPAPKGFFDDVPAPGGGTADLPAPKGFFDDVPAPASAAPVARAGTGTTGVLDLDDLDLEPSRMAPLPGAASPHAPTLELDDAAAPRAASTQPLGIEPFDLEPPGGTEAPALELDAPPSAPAVPSLDLDAPPSAPAVPSLDLDAPPSAPAAPSLDDIGLDAPAAAPPPPGGGVVTFSTPTAPADDVPAAPRLSLSESLASAPPASTDELDLAMDPARAPRRSDVVARVDEAALGEAAPVRKRPMSRARKLAVAAAAVVAVLGAGGFYLYQRHAAEQARAADIARSIATARRALAEDRWLDAAAAAQRALKTDPKHPAALGLAAQAYFAAAIDRGTDAAKLVAEGEAVFRKIAEAAARGPEVDAAAGLRALTERNPTEAIAKLSAAAERDRRDPNLPLYLGWAYAQAGDFAKAADAFDHALRKIPKRVPALYGLGLAHIELGNTDAARDALLAVTEIDPAHIGARVGLAQLVEVDRFDAREARYLEILNDPNIAKADPRAVARAWALAGDEALRAGRVDEAVGRYTKALELDPDNVTAVIGEGKAALAQGRYEVARERLKAALSARPDNIDAMVAYAEASLALRDWDAAFDSIESALKRNPKNWRAQYVYGKILAAFPDAEEGAAEEVLRAAVAIAPPGEIAPTVELSKLLVAKGRGQEALAVLRPVEAAAETDAALAVALGVAYLNTGDAARAEQWFRKALDLRPADVEAQLQLGMALGAQEKFDEALAILEKAWEADNTREDVGVRLATLYERAGMDDKAAEIYDALVARPGASLNARGRAGRFYARTGRIDKAVSLGESILAENERDAAGHYLRGEGLYAQGKYAEAQSEFRDATLIDPQAQYYEALGRAMEKQGLLADALRAYERAMGLDGKYLAPRVGRVRIHVSRRQYQEALDEANAALAIAPDDPDLHFYRGESLYEMGRARDAVDAYKRAVGGRPDFAYAYYRMGKAYVDLDKPRDAVAALAKATRLAEGSEAAWLADAHYYLATAARTAGDRGTAIRAFRAFLDMSPDDARARDARKLLLRLEAGGR